MSSVGSSDSASGNSSNEVIRRTREEASKAESDLVKKHAKEIRRLNEKHYDEVEKLKADHDEQIDDLRKVGHEDINQRDHKFQKDIEDMRGVYKKQLQAQADETSRREMATRQVKDEGTHDKELSEKRIEQLNRDNMEKLRTQEQNFDGNLKANREAQERDLGDVHDRLTRRYEGEAKLVRDEHEKQLGELQKNYTDYRREVGTSMEAERMNHMSEKQHDSEELLRAVKKERQEGVDNAAYLREGFKDGLDKTRERFEKQAAVNRDAQNRAQNRFKNSVGDRIENDVNRLKRENADLKEQSTRGDLEMRQQAKREGSNMADSYQKNIDNYREQRDSALNQANDRVHKNVEKLRKDYDEQAFRQSRYYQDQSDVQERISRKAIDQMKTGYEAQNTQTKTTADSRVKTIAEHAADERARMVDYQAENHTAAQRNHQEEMKALRATLESDKDAAVSSLEDRLQKQELQHADRMNQVVAKYEKQVQTLKDQIVRDKKTSDENLKRTVDDMQRSQKAAVDQLEAQNKTRLRQMDQMHSEELKTARKSNDEKMNQIIVETKRS